MRTTLISIKILEEAVAAMLLVILVLRDKNTCEVEHLNQQIRQ